MQLFTPCRPAWQGVLYCAFGTLVGRAGAYEDLLASLGGVFSGAEVKVWRERLRPLQRGDFP